MIYDRSVKGKAMKSIIGSWLVLVAVKTLMILGACYGVYWAYQNVISPSFGLPELKVKE
jgi:hypothetical protein